MLYRCTILAAGWNIDLISRTQPECSQSMVSGEWVQSMILLLWILCSGLWGLIGTGLLVAGPESECNLHATFEGLCYCELRLPPAVCCPSPSLPRIITVPFAHVGTRGEDFGTDPWFSDHLWNWTGFFCSVVWSTLCHPHQSLCAGLGKDEVSV